MFFLGVSLFASLFLARSLSLALALSLSLSLCGCLRFVSGQQEFRHQVETELSALLARIGRYMLVW